MAPKVSIIMPAHNTANYIAKAIESALHQTLHDIEVIVVDDASSDDTPQIVAGIADERVKFYRQKQNLGAAAARNRALTAASGEWIAVLDSDDWYAPKRLETLLAVAQKHNATMVCDDLWFIGDQDSEPWTTLIRQSGESISSELIVDATFYIETDVHGQQGLHLGISKPLIRRSFLTKHNITYDEAVRLGQDFFLYLECLIQGAKFVLYPEAFYFYRARQGSLVTKSQVARLSQACQAMEKLLLRPIVRENTALYKALRNHLKTYRRNLAYYSVVEPFKRKEFSKAMLEMIKNPTFVFRFVQQIPKLLAERLKRLPSNGKSSPRSAV